MLLQKRANKQHNVLNSRSTAHPQLHLVRQHQQHRTAKHQFQQQRKHNICRPPGSLLDDAIEAAPPKSLDPALVNEGSRTKQQQMHEDTADVKP
jgi:hypothetical protein